MTTRQHASLDDEPPGSGSTAGVTQTGVLELAEAGAAYLELGLGTVGAAHPRGEHDHQLSLLDCGQEVELPQQRPSPGSAARQTCRSCTSCGGRAWTPGS